MKINITTYCESIIISNKMFKDTTVLLYNSNKQRDLEYGKSTIHNCYYIGLYTDD